MSVFRFRLWERDVKNLHICWLNNQLQHSIFICFFRSIKVHWPLKGLMDIVKWLTSLKLVNVPTFQTSLLCDSYASAVGRKHILGIYKNSITHYRDFEMDLFKMATKKRFKKFATQGNYQWFLFYNHWIRFWPKKLLTH